MAASFNSVWIDFTKGLGAPLGAVLAGSAAFIDEAWRWKQRLGGGMRQAGICAAACLYALDHHVDRLAEDHRNAKALARGLRQMPGVAVEEPETNLVFFDPAGAGLAAPELIAAAAACGRAPEPARRPRARLHPSRRHRGDDRGGAGPDPAGAGGALSELGTHQFSVAACRPGGRRFLTKVTGSTQSGDRERTPRETVS